MAKQKLKLKRSAAAVLYGLGLLAVTTALYALFPSAFENGKNAQTSFTTAALAQSPQNADAASSSSSSDRSSAQALEGLSSAETEVSASSDSADAASTQTGSETSETLEETARKAAASSKDDYGFAIREADGQNAKTILIDAGHGGSDLGDGAKDGSQENNIVLDYAKKLKAHLEKQNPDLHVVLTREDDTRLGSNDWNDTAARIQKQEDVQADYVISLHAHASDDPSASGFQIILNDDDDMAKDLASRIVENFATVSWLPDRGIVFTRDYPLQMISMSNAHAIELDLGLLSSDTDLSYLKDSARLEQSAAAAAAAISDTILYNPGAPGYASRQKQNAASRS
ncbi:N-acetylmuramoyl-L-alanine amidase [Allobaculum fili]|uniref:N-acetylmuramoyl-L-alanine amidase n=1 Tax=Allobaculum fili TaxID=2834460 RepID=UPI001E3A4685|nr:N-acetylmuramoyl-L-alanine amidase [Allobaculum fili]